MQRPSRASCRGATCGEAPPSGVPTRPSLRRARPPTRTRRASTEEIIRLYGREQIMDRALQSQQQHLNPQHRPLPPREPPQQQAAAMGAAHRSTSSDPGGSASGSSESDSGDSGCGRAFNGSDGGSASGGSSGGSSVVGVGGSKGVVRCPSCSNALRVGMSATPGTYSCPACTTRFIVNPSLNTAPASHANAAALGGAAAPGPTCAKQTAAAANQANPRAGVPVAVPTARAYQANCPRCKCGCRFTTALRLRLGSETAQAQTQDSERES